METRNEFFIPQDGITDTRPWKFVHLDLDSRRSFLEQRKAFDYNPMGIDDMRTSAEAYIILTAYLFASKSPTSVELFVVF